ncbi:glutaredoxin family protein [Arthrobacter sp. STN4]|uniref:glutaredoxin family protein n=1 Tax=Arthrobacter sp. STN4 TaxID=2923276 RepID=UPI00211A2E20|nr:glutaredoxin family protein [Arthrobacter sp. STN4]MCQ9165129.1 glutaredoxin family protein [Arthrobacter sp. STN4]
MEPVSGATPTLELITKAECHLCEDARAVVAAVAAPLGLAWSERRIDGDPALAGRYGEEVPVVLVDGVPRDFWHIDPVRLRTVLVGLMGADGPPEAAGQPRFG